MSHCGSTHLRVLSAGATVCGFSPDDDRCLPVNSEGIFFSGSIEVEVVKDLAEEAEEEAVLV